MVKRKYSTNSALAHAWADNNDTSVLREGSNFWCQYDRIYSFSTCIAEIFNGATICSTHSHSSYTSRHQGKAFNAAKGKRIFIDIPNRGHDNLVFNQHDFDSIIVEYNEKNVAVLYVKATGAWKHREHYLASAERILDSLSQYARHVGLEYTVDNFRLAKLQAVVLLERRHNWGFTTQSGTEFDSMCPHVALGKEQAQAMLRTGGAVSYRESDWPEDVYLPIDTKRASILHPYRKGSFWHRLGEHHDIAT